jgi:transcription antitermination factor NusB
MISTNDVRPGMALSLHDGLFTIVEYQHVKPGKGKAFVRMKLKKVETGAVLDRTFRADEDVDRAFIDKKEHQYLYRDDLGFHLRYQTCHNRDRTRGTGTTFCNYRRRRQGGHPLGVLPHTRVTSEPRDRALQELYELDVRGHSDAPVGDSRRQRLVQGVLEHRTELDEAIERVSSRWRLDRMPPVDRTILRIGLYELRYADSVPMAVVVSEAVRLAKTYSTERSSAFVNGVLSALAKEERPQELPESKR